MFLMNLPNSGVKRVESNFLEKLSRRHIAANRPHQNFSHSRIFANLAKIRKIVEICPTNILST